MRFPAAGFAVRHARHVGMFPRRRCPEWILVGQDGGQSLRCGSGTMFLFSDTLVLCSDPSIRPRGQPAPVPVPDDLQTIFLANCGGISDAATIDGALGSLRYFADEDGLPREILPADERERFRRVRFWPEHGVAIGDRVYLYYLGIQTTDESSPWGFRSLGTGLAEIDPATGGSRRITRGGDWLLWRNTADDLHIGVQVCREDEWLYVFGSVRRELQSDAILARVHPERIEDPAAYEFLASTRPAWTSTLAGATSLGPASTSYSVSFNPHLGRYTLFFVDSYQRRLMLRTSHHLWGPYSAPCDLFGLVAKPASELVYLGFEHSAFQQRGGESVFISYCEPHFSLASLVTVTLDRLEAAVASGT